MFRDRKSQTGFIPRCAKDKVMTKRNVIPDDVANLRRLWNKKIKPNYTQIEAAKKLGWTQGAISQYLNNITELNSAAVIKLANFMEVDPRDISPNITEHLPNVRTIQARYNSSNMSKKIDKKIHYQVIKESFFVEMAEDTECPHTVLEVCEPAAFRQATKYLVVVKGTKSAEIYNANELPPQKQIKNKYAILNVNVASCRVK